MKKQGVLPYVIEILKRSDAITAWAGLPLVVETMRALGLDRLIQKFVHVRKRKRGFSETKKVETIVQLMSAGGECVDDVEILKADPGLQRLQGDFPGPDALLDFLYQFHDDRLIEQAKARRTKDQVAYIPEENEALQGLAKVNLGFVHRVAAELKCTRATLDHDATIQESHKREAQFHYKGGRGYQPSVIYWAELDMVLADEYRDGNVPAGMSNLPLIKRGFASLPETITERNFRGDSACYEEKVLKWLADPEREDGPRGHIGFTISADMTTELRKICEAVPETKWELADDRPHETVQCAEVEFTPGIGPRMPNRCAIWHCVFKPSKESCLPTGARRNTWRWLRIARESRSRFCAGIGKKRARLSRFMTSARTNWERECRRAGVSVPMPRGFA